MKKNDLSHSDISERQQGALNSMLSRSAGGRGTAAPKESLEVARFGKTVYEVSTTRDQTRVLFISRDEALLSGGAHSIDGYLNLGEVFDEVHIVLLRSGSAPVRFPVLRVSSNVWLYIASAKDWWRTPFTALTVIDEHLAFAGGFRADIIIAHDPFESALVATIASGRYERPYQIHIQHDFYHPRFLLSDNHPRLRRWLGRYLLKRAVSVRTVSDQISQMVRSRFQRVLDVATLPRFNKFEASLADPVVYDVKKLYPEFEITILYIGSLNHNNLVHQVIDGIRPLCGQHNIGLIIAGAGPAKADLEKRVKRLKLDRHVVFETAVTKQADYLKTTDVLIVTDTTSASDELVIQGAVFHTALVTVPTTIRTDLFEHNSSILFFEPGKTSMITAHLRELVSDKSLCVQMSNAARRVVGERLHTSPSSYRHEYRASIERVLFLDDEQSGTADTEVVKE
ncbi:MAG: glycosyltransferase [Candidatus Paceibacteria bacterium]